MKKCCFIIPYFGKFPNYFQLFLNSCGCNKDFNWLLFTDDRDKFVYPANVKVIYVAYEDFKRKIQAYFDFPIVISTPHKLCDFKPAYGLLFEDYLRDFKFWGYCDLDLIMGCLNNFLTDELFEKYDKIFCLGHMTLYKNTYENNRMFMRDYKGIKLYKEVFSSEKTVTFDEEWRDEYNVNRIFLTEGKKVFSHDFSMNTSVFHNKFVRIQFVGFDVPNDGHGYIEELPRKALYVWENGNIRRYFMHDNELKVEEFIYIHLQARGMKLDKHVINSNSFKIIPNKFVPLEVNTITAENFHKIKNRSFCLYIQKKLWNNFRKRIESHFKL